MTARQSLRFKCSQCPNTVTISLSLPAGCEPADIESWCWRKHIRPVAMGLEVLPQPQPMVRQEKP